MRKSDGFDLYAFNILSTHRACSASSHSVARVLLFAAPVDQSRCSRLCDVPTSARPHRIEGTTDWATSPVHRLRTRSILPRHLQSGVSIERHPPGFSHVSLGHSLGASPAPGGTCRFASRYRAPFGSGFPKKNLPAATAQRTGEIFLRSLRRKHVCGLGSGAHSRHFVQECPE